MHCMDCYARGLAIKQRHAVIQNFLCQVSESEASLLESVCHQILRLAAHPDMHSCQGHLGLVPGCLLDLKANARSIRNIDKIQVPIAASTCNVPVPQHKRQALRSPFRCQLPLRNRTCTATRHIEHIHRPRRVGHDQHRIAVDRDATVNRPPAWPVLHDADGPPGARSKVPNSSRSVNGSGHQHRLARNEEGLRHFVPMF
mmetsp:Transcript_58968/g.149671  ORF Transcript_58968/g.149671 Transcript_58968/m.149671 type:complete len:200 (-) Transcript_58968:575-1174(-)